MVLAEAVVVGGAADATKEVAAAASAFRMKAAVKTRHAKSSAARVK